MTHTQDNYTIILEVHAPRVNKADRDTYKTTAETLAKGLRDITQNILNIIAFALYQLCTMKQLALELCPQDGKSLVIAQNIILFIGEKIIEHC